ncbi:Full=OctTKFull=OctTK-II [Octopus vulgaris]|uniref:OctTK-II n=1 Tax=Octopus vulgaris TaxID=6645 RepID=A0AA36AK91_OCTVU|nr:Full=OctTKFull=OctTK-II [Octopus vulgaris]
MIRVGLILCCIFIVGVFEASSADDILTAHNLIKRSEVKPPSSSEFVGLMGRSEELTRRLIQHPGSMSETILLVIFLESGGDAFSLEKRNDIVGSDNDTPYAGVGSDNDTPYDGVVSYNDTPYAGVGSYNDTPYAGVGSYNDTPYAGVESYNDTPYDGVVSDNDTPHAGVVDNIQDNAADDNSLNKCIQHRMRPCKKGRGCRKAKKCGKRKENDKKRLREKSS